MGLELDFKNSTLALSTILLRHTQLLYTCYKFVSKSGDMCANGD